MVLTQISEAGMGIWFDFREDLAAASSPCHRVTSIANALDTFTGGFQLVRSTLRDSSSRLVSSLVCRRNCPALVGLGFWSDSDPSIGPLCLLVSRSAIAGNQGWVNPIQNAPASVIFGVREGSGLPSASI